MKITTFHKERGRRMSKKLKKRNKNNFKGVSNQKKSKCIEHMYISLISSGLAEVINGNLDINHWFFSWVLGFVISKILNSIFEKESK